MLSMPSMNMEMESPAIFKHEIISPFMRKGIVGDWKNYFSEEQSNIVDEMGKERLKGLDLVFHYE